MYRFTQRPIPLVQDNIGTSRLIRWQEANVMSWYLLCAFPLVFIVYCVMRRIDSRSVVDRGELRKARRDVKEWLGQLDAPERHQGSCRCPICLEARRSQNSALNKAA